MIKDIFLTVILLFLINCEISCQKENGYFMLGGGSKLSFTSLNTNWESNLNVPKRISSLDFSPSFGFFISNNFVLGAELPIQVVTEKIMNTKEKTTTAAIGPFVRLYLKEEGDVRPFVHGMAGYGHMFHTISWESGVLSYGLFLYEIDAGLGIFINERVCLDFELGYASVKYNAKSSQNLEKSEYFSTKGIGCTIGIAVLL